MRPTERYPSQSKAVAIEFHEDWDGFRIVSEDFEGDSRSLEDILGVSKHKAFVRFSRGYVPESFQRGF